MLTKEKVSIPSDLKEKKQWICYKTDLIGKEEVYIPFDPTTGEIFKENDSSKWMTYENASELQENSAVKVSVGFVLEKDDAFAAIEVYNAIDSDGVLSEVASKITEKLKNEFYGVINGTSLIMLVKESSIERHHFKNIKVSHFDSNHIVRISEKATWIPKEPWKPSRKTEKIKQYHFMLDCQVDESSEVFPDHYEQTKSGRLRFLPNILASTLLKQKEWLMCNQNVYVREKGEDIFRKIDIDEIEQGIMGYMSQKYLRNSEVEDTKKLLLKRIPRDNELLDPNRMKGKINFEDGVYDYKSNTFGPYAKGYKTAYQLDVNFKNNVQCPSFIQYLSSSLFNDDDIKTVQEMIGYQLTTEMGAEKAFILYGPGRTGKSTLIHLIESIIGKDYVSNLSFQDLGSKFRTIQLHGKILNTFSDLPQSEIKETGTFKSLVSGDSLDADRKFEKGISFKNTARFLFATNKLPTNTTDDTFGFYRRLIVIPFLKVISSENIDRNLKDILYKEREGIVQWALEGLQRLIQNNYEFTESSGAKKILRDYMIANSSTLWFVQEYCEFNPSFIESGKNLYDAYKKACLSARVKLVSQREFYTKIQNDFAKKGVVKGRGAQSRAVEFTGLKLIKTN